MNNLKPIEPLSQVVFVHDYIQFVFQDATLSIYNPVSIYFRDNAISSMQSGFCDSLVALIGQKIFDIKIEPKSAATFTFQGGTKVIVPLGKNDLSGPEAFMYTNGDGTIIVEQNA